MRVVELPEIAKRVGVSPVIARSKLRTMYNSKHRRGLPRPIKHWVFRERDIFKVINLIH